MAFEIISLKLYCYCCCSFVVFDSGFQKWTNEDKSSWLKQASWKFCNEAEDFNCTYFIVIPGIHKALALSKADSHYQKEYKPIYPESMLKRWQHWFLYELCTAKVFFLIFCLNPFYFILDGHHAPTFWSTWDVGKKFGLLRSWLRCGGRACLYTELRIETSWIKVHILQTKKVGFSHWAKPFDLFVNIYTQAMTTLLFFIRM